MRRHALLVLLVLATACQDTPVQTPVPVTPTEPRLALAGGTADLRSGYDYLCALRSGVVVCYGENREGQPVGTHRAGAGSFVQMTVGATHACGLRSDAAVECWGNNDFGRAPPLRRATTGWYTYVSAGLSHSCALRNDGVIECWGSNQYGQAPATRIAATGKFVELSASTNSACGRRTDGAVECWGKSPAGSVVLHRAQSGAFARLAVSVGASHCASDAAGVTQCWGYITFTSGAWTQLAIGSGFLCGIRPDGRTECEGYPGSFTGPDERDIRQGRWTRVSAGAYHACGLRADGYFECFGLQHMGSDAPDVIPVADTPSVKLASPVRVRLTWPDINSNDLRTEISRSVADRDRFPTTWTAVGVVGANRTAFEDSVAANAVYVYRLRVCNAGCSWWKESSAIAVPASAPPRPSSVSASGYVCDFASCARLTWTADNTFAEYFRLQRSTNNGASWTNLPQQDRTTTVYHDYGLTPNTRYVYRVTSCNARGCSANTWSNAIVAPMPPPPPAPSSIVVHWMGDYMYIWWSDVAYETGYELQRRQLVNGAWGGWDVTIHRGMNDYNTYDAVTPGGTYQYRIRACNQGGCSAYTTSPATTASA